MRTKNVTRAANSGLSWRTVAVVGVVAACVCGGFVARARYEDGLRAEQDRREMRALEAIRELQDQATASRDRLESLRKQDSR